MLLGETVNKFSSKIVFSQKHIKINRIIHQNIKSTFQSHIIQTQPMNNIKNPMNFC